MALFKKTTKKAEANTETGTKQSGALRDLSHVLSQVRITEKATMKAESGVYTFNVADRATKSDIIKAVNALYKVTPRLVRIVKVPSKVKRNMRTGRVGVKSGGKKAYVYLKKGETITIS